MEPLETILRTIESRGPISFADYMTAALYGTGGFYEQHPVGRGPGSDFATGPHVSPVFARLLARGLRRLSGGPGVRLVELGAGDGTLGVQLSAELSGSLDYTGVDVSPGAIEAMKRKGLHTATLPDAVPQGWSGIILAHELLDNLPFHRVCRRGDVLEEIAVGIDDERKLIYETRPCPEDVAAAVPPLGEGEEATVPLAAYALLGTLARRLGVGSAVLVIDYESRGAPWGYRDHSRSDDLLESPGSRDITSGPDFEALARSAASLGFAIDAATTQREALMELGYTSVDEELRMEQARAQDEGRAREAVRIWNARQEAGSLVDTGGLGSHKWLTMHLAHEDPEP